MTNDVSMLRTHTYLPQHHDMHGIDCHVCDGRRNISNTRVHRGLEIELLVHVAGSVILSGSSLAPGLAWFPKSVLLGSSLGCPGGPGNPSQKAKGFALPPRPPLEQVCRVPGAIRTQKERFRKPSPTWGEVCCKLKESASASPVVPGGPSAVPFPASSGPCLVPNSSAFVVAALASAVPNPAASVARNPAASVVPNPATVVPHPAASAEPNPAASVLTVVTVS